MSELREHQAGGLEYLELVTSLLQRERVTDPTGGIWEAADLQWWWRRDQHVDPGGATFWFRDGVPVSALVFTDWGRSVGVDVIGSDRAAVADAWSRAAVEVGRLGGAIETSVREDDPASADAAERAGFEPTDGLTVETWMDADERPPITDLPEGFRLLARGDDPSRPHHMIQRNGEHVAERLAECSLYRPDLDLFVVGPGGEAASYGLFWADSVTRVGLVEPMRTEDAFQGRGLAKHVLTAGLDRLARAGCTRLKIAYAEGNAAAKHLYLGAGFHPGPATRAYRLRGSGSNGPLPS